MSDNHEFYDDPISTQEAAEVYKRNQPPAGNYLSLLEDTEPSVTPLQFEGETRKLYSVFLRAGRKMRDGEMVEQSLRFRFSPEPRPKTVFGTDQVVEGKDDSATVRYAELVKAYTDHAGDEGEPLKTIGQLVQFIQSVPLQITTMNGDRGLQVTRISLPARRR